MGLASRPWKHEESPVGRSWNGLRVVFNSCEGIILNYDRKEKEKEEVAAA